MPSFDISLCDNEQCPLRPDCFRGLNSGREYQACHRFAPVRSTTGVYTCEHYEPLIPYEDEH